MMAYTDISSTVMSLYVWCTVWYCTICLCMLPVYTTVRVTLLYVGITQVLYMYSTTSRDACLGTCISPASCIQNLATTKNGAHCRIRIHENLSTTASPSVSSCKNIFFLIDATDIDENRIGYINTEELKALAIATAATAALERLGHMNNGANTAHCA